MTDHVPACQICWRSNVPAMELGQCVSCGHSFCRSCLCTWFQTFENKFLGQRQPTCPTCRVEVNASNVASILGRSLVQSSFQNETACSPPNRPQEEDELLERWLNQQPCAQQCPHCGIWITKFEGCSHVKCFCGLSFIYNCGKCSNCAQLALMMANGVSYYDSDDDDL